MEVRTLIEVHRINWVANSLGDCDVPFDMVGEVNHVVTAPAHNAAPTANYDVYLYDDLDVDILAATGANRSASAAEIVWPYRAVNTYHHAKATTLRTMRLVIANAGPGGAGAVALYVLVS